MKQILLLLSIFSLVIIAACQPAEIAGGKGPAGSTQEGAATVEEPVADEPAAETIAQDLDTSDLDEIEKDLDSLVLE